MYWTQVLFLGTSTVASKYEELECLYAAVGKVIYEGLTNYEKATSNTNTTQLFGKIFASLFLPKPHLLKPFSGLSAWVNSCSVSVV